MRNPLVIILLCLMGSPFLLWAGVVTFALAVKVPWLLAGIVVTIVVLTIRGKRKRRARDLAARADFEHWLYLYRWDDMRGVYGRYLPPEEFQVRL